MAADTSAGNGVRLRGAAPDLIREARDDHDPLPGTTGFAGRLDGALVRDVLGREPLFLDRDDPTAWAFAPTELDEIGRAHV